MAAWKRLSTRLVYKNGPWEVHEDILKTHEGGKASYMRLATRSFACVVPVTDDGKIVLIENYRQASRAHMLEIPGGMSDPGETPQSNSQRELEEETGYRAGELLQLGKTRPIPQLLESTGYLFLGRKLRQGRPHRDVDEDLRTVELPVASVYRRLRAGKIMSSTSMVALLLAEPFLQDVLRTGAKRSARRR